MTPAHLLAHGLGGRTDLPLPAWMFRSGAAAAVLASFAALALLWPQSRLEDGVADRPLVATSSPAVRILALAARLLALVAFAVVLAAAAFGSDQTSTNLAPVAVYVAFWVGLLFVSGLVGDVWPVLSPFDTLAAAGQRLTGLRRRRVPPAAEATEEARANEATEAAEATVATDAEAAVANETTEAGATVATEAEANEVAGAAVAEPAAARGDWGLRPAAAGLLVFVWVELVYPDRAQPRTLFVLMAAYTVAMLAAAARWGRPWLRTGEAFAGLFGVLGHMAPLHRGDDGRLRLRPPFVGLATLTPRPGLEALVMVALGSTTFDGVTRTQWWTDRTTDLDGAGRTLADTAGLLWCIGVVAIAYLVAMHIGAHLVDHQRSADDLRGDFVHSLVPIALAYAVAHYFSLLVLEGQATIALVSDPFGQGWDLFGTATRTIDFTLLSPRAIALVQSGAIVIGHIAGVVIAHDRALALFDRPAATRSQYPLLAVMVLFTVTGLFLLLGG